MSRKTVKRKLSAAEDTIGRGLLEISRTSKGAALPNPSNTLPLELIKHLPKDLYETFSDSSSENLPTDSDNNRRKLLQAVEEMFTDLEHYNTILLQQKKIDRLPPARSLQDLQDQNPKLMGWRKKHVSLDPCVCPPKCPPKGLRWLLDLFGEEPTPEEQDQGAGRRVKKSKVLLKLLILVVLALVPTGSIVVLYVIPNTYGRLGAIFGGSIILITGLAMSKSTEKKDVLAYMVGLAAIQVVFVGSVIENK
ncbi:hypothetical protein BU24DRAFT_184246 [Aaosphaeria arxii CBS 175.79]|uniref:DUF6594 domain-containing protein n=1 Tax=Aaosphaeria arxii CBS 175.79 TaxID=1450172 RepID=A0A6A5XSJ7_9PLEO|nr:uncharacterized protein BU24DRAFT_184246 [Aaosphaeria arxii CBS 175.79]KAF2015731.1 hypothetical protein BU24DRAFT_184246 [Aaosphaeria arxii CBS 175.79]